MATPWLTSDTLVEAVKRKISFPLSQNTMNEDDILAFANEEMMISQVPSVLSYHEEFFVTVITVPIVGGQSRYPIPNRAIGLKLRDLFYVDTQGSLFEMSRISPEDKAFWQQSNVASNVMAKYYFENNDVVLIPDVSDTATGSLQFSFFIRPNQLVQNDRVATISYFTKTIQVVNASVVAGDTVTVGSVELEAGVDFAIGGTSAVTATNLGAALTAAGITNSVNSDVVTVKNTLLSTEVSVSNGVGFVLQSTQGIQFTDQVPSNITAGSIIDFLQTKPGHRILAYDVTIPAGGVSGDTINLSSSDVPSTLVVGDYVASENECIIPMLPPELHTSLSEKVCARILAAIGQTDEASAINSKLQENEVRTGTLIDNRSDGSPQKITAHKTFLHYNKMNIFRRF